MEGNLRQSLGSLDATELVGGMCHGNGCRQETTRLHAIFYRKKTFFKFTTLFLDLTHRCEYPGTCINLELPLDKILPNNLNLRWDFIDKIRIR